MFSACCSTVSCIFDLFGVSNVKCKCNQKHLDVDHSEFISLTSFELRLSRGGLQYISLYPSASWSEVSLATASSVSPQNQCREGKQFSQCSKDDLRAKICVSVYFRKKKKNYYTICYNTVFMSVCVLKMTIYDCLCEQSHWIHRFSNIPQLTPACVRPHPPSACVGQARWTGKVGLGTASSMDPVSQTQPARQSGRTRQDQLADGCPRIMAGWHLQGQQAVRLTDLPLPPSGSLPDPLLNPLPS